MASWIVVIAGTHPQHWDVAKEHGFWDMTKNFQVQLGDTVYFWQGGGSLVAQCEATSSHHPISPAMESPWEDSGEREYVARFTFRVLSDAPTAQPSWGGVLERMGKSYPLQLRELTDPAAEAVLASYFTTDPVGTSYRDEERDKELERLGFDRRKFSYRAIAQRQGQPQFRNQLLRAYKGRCPVTGTEVESVLEAAHIAAFRGSHTNKVYNGILLRADLHTLFDLYRVTITPEFVFKVDDELGEPYRSLDGLRITVPAEPKDMPEAALLAKHNQECPWFSE